MNPWGRFGHFMVMSTNTKMNSNWLLYFRNALIVLMLSVAAYCIYEDGFFRYTWLSHASLAGLMWVVLGNEGSLQAKLNSKSPQMWVALASMTGMVVDLFVVKN